MIDKLHKFFVYVMPVLWAACAIQAFIKGDNNTGFLYVMLTSYALQEVGYEQSKSVKGRLS